VNFRYTFHASPMRSAIHVPTFSGTKKTANDTLRDVMHRIYHNFFFTFKSLQFHGTRVNDYKYAHKKYAFSAPSFTKLSNIQQCYVQFSYTEFHPHRTTNTENTDRFITHLSMAFTAFSWNSPSLNELLCTSPYRLSYKSDEKGRKCGQNITYALK
jgi:hypothetical protein